MTRLWLGGVVVALLAMGPAVVYAVDDNWDDDEPNARSADIIGIQTQSQNGRTTTCEVWQDFEYYIDSETGNVVRLGNVGAPYLRNCQETGGTGSDDDDCAPGDVECECVRNPNSPLCQGGNPCKPGKRPTMIKVGPPLVPGVDGFSATTRDGIIVDILKGGVLSPRPTTRNVVISNGKLLNPGSGREFESVNVVAVLMDEARGPDVNFMWDLWGGDFYDRVRGQPWEIWGDLLINQATGVTIKLAKPKLYHVAYSRNWEGVLVERADSNSPWMLSTVDRLEIGREYGIQEFFDGSGVVAQASPCEDDDEEDCTTCRLIEAAGDVKSTRFLNDCKNKFAPKVAALMCHQGQTEINGGAIPMKLECWDTHIHPDADVPPDWQQFPPTQLAWPLGDEPECLRRWGRSAPIPNRYRDYLGCRDRWQSGMPGGTHNQVRNVNFPAATVGNEVAVSVNAHDGLNKVCADKAIDIAAKGFEEAQACRVRNRCPR